LLGGRFYDATGFYEASWRMAIAMGLFEHRRVPRLREIVLRLIGT